MLKDFAAFTRQVGFNQELFDSQKMFAEHVLNDEDLVCITARQRGTTTAMILLCLYHLSKHKDTKITYFCRDLSAAKWCELFSRPFRRGVSVSVSFNAKADFGLLFCPLRRNIDLTSFQSNIAIFDNIYDDCLDVFDMEKFSDNFGKTIVLASVTEDSHWVKRLFARSALGLSKFNNLFLPYWSRNGASIIKYNNNINSWGDESDEDVKRLRKQYKMQNPISLADVYGDDIKGEMIRCVLKNVL